MPRRQTAGDVSTAPLILKLGTRMEVTGQLHGPTVEPPPGKNASNPLNKGPGRPQSHLDVLEKRKISDSCWDSNCKSFSPNPTHCTHYT